MLPPETLPPGDPSGGVVYLRNEILPLQKALWLFLNMDVTIWGIFLFAHKQLQTWYMMTKIASVKLKV